MKLSRKDLTQMGLWTIMGATLGFTSKFIDLSIARHTYVGDLVLPTQTLKSQYDRALYGAFVDLGKYKLRNLNAYNTAVTLTDRLLYYEQQVGEKVITEPHEEDKAYTFTLFEEIEHNLVDFKGTIHAYEKPKDEAIVNELLNIIRERLNQHWLNILQFVNLVEE